ncbi:MAG TPA: FtsX-like permease family protein [Chitinophagaceae bacterium]|nr:FtsX-like permease family protein [Chitinophagaceae bacterium]
MNFLFAWRYFKAKKTTNAINIIAWISITAIIIGTASLILVLSVFNGFEDLVKSLYSSFYPDLKIAASSGKQITLTQEQLNRLRSFDGIKSISLIAEEKALLQNGEYQSIVYLKGVDDQYNTVARVSDHIIKGEFKIGTADQPLLILGAGIENAVGVQSDRNLSPLVVYLPRKTEVNLSNPLQSISADTINTSGAFMIQQDFDNKYAITNIQFVKKMLDMNDSAFTAAELSFSPGAHEENIQDAVKSFLGKEYSVQTRYEQNRSLYSIMQVEKWVIYGVLSLILVVAAFNMIGALTMLVLEKKEDISVLHALGASQSFIQKVFLSEGLLLAIIGGGVGMLLALSMALIQIHFKIIPLKGGSFLIDYFPVKLSIADFLLVSLTVFAIALIASWIPARKAAMQQFALRSE